MTFLKNYCQAGNLSALMNDDKLPDVLKPYKTRLEALYNSPPSMPKLLSNSDRQALDDNVLNLLVKLLNDEKKETCVWMRPQEWCMLSPHESKGFALVPAHAYFSKNIFHKEVTYSTFTQSPKNSFIVFKSRTGGTKFGRIFSIFTHRRAPKPLENIFDTWLYIQCFPKLPSEMYNPLSKLKVHDVQFHIRSWGPTEDRLIKASEVVAHCSWVMYRPGEIHKELRVPTVALVSMER